MRKFISGKIVLTGIFVFLQAFLCSATTIQIYTELYFLPWLVRVGQIPYRDFFDHHGFLIYYFLAPLSLPPEVNLLKWGTILLCVVNLLLFLYLLRKKTLGLFALGGGLFILFSYVMVQNTLSYDLFLLPFFLGIAALLQGRQEKHPLLIAVSLGLLVGSITLIKFLPGLLVLGVIFYFRKIAFGAVCTFLPCWAVAVGYLIYVGAFNQFIEGYFTFNGFLLHRMPLVKFEGLLDPQLPIFAVLGVTIATTCILMVQNYRASKKPFRKFLRDEDILFLGLILSSLPFLASGIHVGHLLTLFPFVLLLLIHSLTAPNQKRRRRLTLVLGVIVVALFLISGRVWRHANLRTPEYINDPISAQMVSALRRRNLEQKRLFINGGYVTVYYLLSSPSHNRFPMKFPLMTEPKLEDFDPDYEKSLMRSLSENDVEIVIWVTRPYQPWGELKELYSFVKANYQLLEDVDSPVVHFELYQKPPSPAFVREN